MKISGVFKSIACLLLGAAAFAASCFVCAAQEPAEDPGSLRFTENGPYSNVSVGPSVQSGVRLDFRYGYRNTAKNGHRLPVTVIVTNHDPHPLEGTLLIEAPDSIEAGLGYFEPAVTRTGFGVSVPAGSTAEIDAMISLPEEDARLRIALYGEDGVLLSEKQADISLEPGGADLLIGLLSDYPEELSYFDGLNVAGTALRTRTIELDPGTMPEKSSELEQLDLIIVSGFSVSRIDRERLEAIREWVRGGGILLVGSGGSTSAARIFGSSMAGDFTITGPRVEDVDMGMKYSKTGPDGAVLSLNVCDITASGAVQAMQSSDIALLTTVAGVNGVIGFTAFDLCEISSFCSQEIRYTDELLQSLLGSGRIARLLGAPGGSSEVYERAGSFVGISDTRRLPNIGLYIILAVLYLAFAFGILYFWLRRRGLELYYHPFAVIAAFVCAIAVWAVGSPYRNNGLELSYTLVRETRGDTVTESGFVKLFSAAAGEYEIGFPDNCDFYPVAHSSDTEAAASGREEGNAAGQAADDGKKELPVFTFSHTPGAGSLKAQGLGPFAGKLLEFVRQPEKAAGTGAPSDAGSAGGELVSGLSFFEEKAGGRVVNNTGYRIEDAAILLYGRVLRLGDLEPGAELSLQDYPAMVAPEGDPEAVAAYLTGLKDLEPGSSAYIRALQRTGLLSYYIQDAMGAGYGGARFVGFGNDGNLFEDLVSDTHMESAGTLLLVHYAELDTRRGKRVWRYGLATGPTLISGEYDSAANTSRGAVVLEYELGSDVSVNRLYFTGLSDVFKENAPAGFAGQIALYNYQSGNYELVGQDAVLSDASIRPYLSPSNTLLVRYMPGSQEAGQEGSFLPVPNIIGTER